MNKLYIVLLILPCSISYGAPPTSTLSKNTGPKTSGNMGVRTRFTDSTGKSLGSKTTYDYGPGNSVRSNYFDRSGKPTGTEVGKSPKSK